MLPPQSPVKEPPARRRERSGGGLADKSQAAGAAAHSGAALLRQGDLAAAEAALRTALEIAEQLGDMEQQAAIAGDLGIIYQLRKNMVQACTHWRHARDLARLAGSAGETAKYECRLRAVGGLD